MSVLTLLKGDKEKKKPREEGTGKPQETQKKRKERKGELRKGKRMKEKELMEIIDRERSEGLGDRLPGVRGRKAE